MIYINMMQLFYLLWSSDANFVFLPSSIYKKFKIENNFRSIRLNLMVKLMIKGMDFSNRPILVFWESTKACLLKCRHCRAEAIEKPLPGELSTAYAKKFISSLKDFGKPYPVLIITGGDPLMRKDLFEIMDFLMENKIPFALAPSVTPNLNLENLKNLISHGLKSVSISLDGIYKTHDEIRGIDGHYNETLKVIKMLKNFGLKLQVNTTVMKNNYMDLPEIVKLLKDLEIDTWEVFFLIKVGRGMAVEELSPHGIEDVLNFLYDVSRYGIRVRTVEAPFFRRIVIWRKNGRKYTGPIYENLYEKLIKMLGETKEESLAESSGTRDGKGVIFVSHDGDVYPSGFIPISLGNVRNENIVEIYRKNHLLLKIRNSEFNGKCGVCEFKDLCGGSRSRAYSYFNDPLGSDPACIYKP